jgi:membrane protease YdiL (CAAX protease family)
MREQTEEKPDGDDYWLRARQPLHCLLFLLPLLGVYEAGVLQMGTASGGDELRNGADYWMRTALRLAGVEQVWTLPLFILGLLFLWQVAGRYRWNLSPGTLVGMLAESVLFGAALIALGQLQEMAFRQHFPGSLPVAAVTLSHAGSLPQAIGFVGAGIYEEVLFRLCLLPITILLLRILFVPRALALLLAIVATSGLFSAAHYLGPAADPWTLYSFTFRLLAGCFFAILFVMRGFGITVGAHAAYDLLVGVLLPGTGFLE